MNRPVDVPCIAWLSGKRIVIHDHKNDFPWLTVHILRHDAVISHLVDETTSLGIYVDRPSGEDPLWVPEIGRRIDHKPIVDTGDLCIHILAKSDRITTHRVDPDVVVPVAVELRGVGPI